jgi:hypothetical protein
LSCPSCWKRARQFFCVSFWLSSAQNNQSGKFGGRIFLLSFTCIIICIQSNEDIFKRIGCCGLKGNVSHDKLRLTHTWRLIFYLGSVLKICVRSKERVRWILCLALLNEHKFSSHCKGLHGTIKFLLCYGWELLVWPGRCAYLIYIVKFMTLWL